MSVTKGNMEYIHEGMVFHGNIPYVMGTRLDVIVVGLPESDVLQLWERLCELVFSLDRMLNRFSPESEISKLNAHPPENEPSPEMQEIIDLAKLYNERTCGIFDVCQQDGKLDMGGFAKGYFLKKCREILWESGVGSAFVDFGGSSIIGVGHHPYGDSWKVGVINPYTRVQMDEIALSDTSMSTSGNTPAYSGHIRHPLTGKVNYEKKMVTVVSGDPLDAEVLSTVMMVATDDERAKIMGNFSDATVISFNL